jgi:hypothetical protein
MTQRMSIASAESTFVHAFGSHVAPIFRTRDFQRSRVRHSVDVAAGSLYEPAVQEFCRSPPTSDVAIAPTTMPELAVKSATTMQAVPLRRVSEWKTKERVLKASPNEMLGGGL